MNDKQIISRMQEGIVISGFNEKDLNSFIQIHIENLFSDSEFSKMYLTERFKYLLEYENAVTLSAKDVNGNMLGLVYGGPEGYKNQMNNYIIKKIVWKLLRKPYLLLNGEFRYKYRSILKRIVLKFIPMKSIVKSSSENENVYLPPEPILRLTGIAVLEKYSHLGIGKQLTAGYENAAKEKKYRSIILETPRTNLRAIKFYEKFGWKKYISEDTNLGKVYFYKLIPENN